MTTKIEISHKTIIFTLVLLAAIWFVWLIRDILLFLFIAFIVMSALRPSVDGLEKRKMPRFLAILLLYVIVFGVIGLSIAGIIPSLIIQSTHLMQDLPKFIERMLPYWNLNLNDWSRQLAPLGQNLVRMTINIFSNVITIVTTLVFVFYFLLERKHMKQTLAGFVGDAASVRIMLVLERIENRLGMCVQGQLILMLIIGIMTYAGLLLLKIDFALPLALFAGLLEIVPNIGPVISAIPAVIVALATSPVAALTVIALFIFVHQSENNFIVPLVMKKSVGLSPLMTIFALMVGGKLAGIAGAVLAVPVVLIIQELISVILSSKK